MHRVGTGDFAGGKQRRDIEIAVTRERWADTHAFVGKPHMHSVLVCRRVHGHRGDTKLLAGAQHAKRDFPAVCDQDLLEHYSMIISGSPNSIGWPSSMKI